ncbi:hypothetical protein L227DRAFT_568579 [Lentinus tigrinus ALCF2SS1-6]|uniref:C2 domain-containing protein n=1 Tax=Lentinus tigrinus ALCF2SS1-6 TaxID=1328759 RepID=A0A5C2RQJ7_9APHY|nr:hypothetical protein L227DRAFT_568579 [Lentinus tigrinus ALCF2SS1-6]
MDKAFRTNGEIAFDPEGGFFEPYVRQSTLITRRTDDAIAMGTGCTCSMLPAMKAIAADKAEGKKGHRSSIVDLFDSLRLRSRSCKTSNGPTSTNCKKPGSSRVSRRRDMFMAEIFARPTDYLRPQKSSAWLEKAKRLAERNEKIEAMTSKESLILENSAPPVPEKVDRGDRLLFTVKVVIAEGLIPLEGSPSAKLDTFVMLSDEQGNRTITWHTTPTIYESFSPRWDESFDLSVDTSLWIMISVRDRALVGKHDIVGRAYLRLDPKRFGDFMTFVLPLLLSSRWPHHSPPMLIALSDFSG